MFSHLADFGYQRSKKQALGFYFTYALGLIVIGGIVGFWAGLVQLQLNHGAMDYQQLEYVGAIVAAIGSAGIAYAVVASKHLKAAYLLVVPLAAIAGGLAGGFVGLLFAAVVTTKPAAARAQGMQMSEVVR
jgi:hypothetical protein